MICAWKELLCILPQWLRSQAASYDSELQELRLRCGCPPELLLRSGRKWGTGTVSQEDLNYCINTASRYFPRDILRPPGDTESASAEMPS